MFVTSNKSSFFRTPLCFLDSLLFTPQQVLNPKYPVRILANIIANLKIELTFIENGK